jgi:hypothetical protein
MEIFKELNKKGYKHYYEGTVEELDSMDKDNQHLHSEIMQVIMWFYEKHGIWIYTWYSDINMTFRAWIHTLRRKGSDIIEVPVIIICKSPTESYESAIEYTLKNLI